MNCGIKEIIKECKKDVISGKCGDCWYNDKPLCCFESLEDAKNRLEGKGKI